MSELSELSEFIRNSLHPGLTKAVQDHFEPPKPKPGNLGSGMAAKAAQAEVSRPQRINNAVDEAAR